MEASTEYPKVKRGEGYAVGHLDDLGEGPGFRKVRKGLDVTAFGVNAIVMPPGYETRLPLPRDPGGALLRPSRHDRDGVRRRLGRAPAGGRVRARGRRHPAQAAQRRRGRRRLPVRRRQGRLRRPRRHATATRTRRAAPRAPRAPASRRSPEPRSTAAARASRQLRMARGEGLEINGELTIPLAEITLRASRSSGPGRTARQRHRLAGGSELRRARLALAERRAAPARCSRAPARGSWRSPRTSAPRRATASSPWLAWRAARAGARRPPSAAAPPVRPRPRASGAFRPSAGEPNESASAVRPRTDLGPALVEGAP